MSKSDENYAKLQELGKTTAESIAEMVAALNVDYDRLTELDDNEQGSLSTEELDELIELKKLAGECRDSEDAEQRIQEDALEVTVRGPWHPPMSPVCEPVEFCILLSTGGPATRIRGELDDNGQPRCAWIECQDWFLPWTQYNGDAVSQDDLLTYCQQFYFGE